MKVEYLEAINYMENVIGEYDSINKKLISGGLLQLNEILPHIVKMDQIYHEEEEMFGELVANDIFDHNGTQLYSQMVNEGKAELAISPEMIEKLKNVDDVCEEFYGVATGFLTELTELLKMTKMKVDTLESRLIDLRYNLLIIKEKWIEAEKLTPGVFKYILDVANEFNNSLLNDYEEIDTPILKPTSETKDLLFDFIDVLYTTGNVDTGTTVRFISSLLASDTLIITYRFYNSFELFLTLLEELTLLAID